MLKSRVQFHLRIKHQASPEEMQLRLEKALNIQLKKTNSYDNEGGIGYEANVLGFWIILGWTNSANGEQVFQLSGLESDDIRNLGEKFELIKIDEFMKDVLVKRDSDDWYVPSEDELRKDLKVD